MFNQKPLFHLLKYLVCATNGINYTANHSSNSSCVCDERCVCNLIVVGDVETVCDAGAVCYPAAVTYGRR